jgi:hypothetical protein
MDEMLYRMVQDSTLRVGVKNEPLRGTAFFVAPGLALTCDYVAAMKDGEELLVAWRDVQFAATVSAYRDGLALLQIQKPASVEPIVYLSESIRPGDVLYGFAYT